MLSLIPELTKSRTLLRDFVMRDLKSRYVGSSMGFFWSVIFPLINLFVFMFVFRIILKTRWGDEQGALEVSLVMLAGIIAWTGFAEAVSRCTNCLVDNANLIQKVVFPASILPSFITISALLNMCFGIPIVIGAVLWFGHLSPPAGAVETENHFLTVPEGYSPVDGEGNHVNANGDEIPWPRILVGLERAWRQETHYKLIYSGTATRGEDYIALHDDVILPAGAARLFLPIIPIRDNVLEGPETIEVTIVDSGGRELWKDATVMTLEDSQLSPAEMKHIDDTFEVKTASYVSAESRDHHPLSLGLPIVLLPLLVILLGVFTVGLGAFFAAFNLYWRDTAHLIGVGLTVWMFATPIFYPANLVQKAGMGLILSFNPMYWFVEVFRDVTLFGIWPNPIFLGLFAAASFLTFWLGGRFFLKHQHHFPDLL